MRLLVMIAALYATGLAARLPPPDGARWEPHRAVPQIMDMAGPRSDGAFVVATYRDVRLLERGRRLRVLVSQLPTSRQVEPHVAVTPRQAVPAAGCSWRRDDVFVTGPRGHRTVFRIDRHGAVRRFADLGPGLVPSGIAYDDGGSFGHRLLVVAVGRPLGTLYAVDCRGRVTTIAPHIEYAEGNPVIAPRGFGPYAGAAITVNEYTGHVIWIRADGSSGTLATPPLPHGLDRGPESVGFVPSWLGPGDRLLIADRDYPEAPPHGNEAVMRLDAGGLLRAGVRAGDLLVATEAHLRLAAVRCRQSCASWLAARPHPTGHGESPILFERRG